MHMDQKALLDAWEPVIGLEIHVQLNTRTKLFSSAISHFGDEPNTNISEVCTGLPGSLPVLNREAVRKAVQFGCAIEAEVSPYSRFDRKSYFYPDSPRNFQITQFDYPIIRGGRITAEVDGEMKTFAVTRAHLEDDAGMLKHFSNFAGVDYNRAGSALLEIVSEPCMRSAKEAAAYAMAVKAIMEYLDASDCNMDEGSLRIDVNISVRPKGETALRSRVEIKNMNSFYNVQLAINAEFRRQVAAYLAAPFADSETVIGRGTYRFDVETGTTVLMRQKEEAQDYRYFPEPDLVPLFLSSEYVAAVRSSLPELPAHRLSRYLTELQLPPSSATLLVNDKSLSDYFEEALKTCSHAKSLSNWLTVEFTGRLKETGTSIRASGIEAKQVASLVNLIHEGVITGKIAKAVADEMVKYPGKDCLTIIRENPEFTPVQDASSIEPLVDQVLRENPQSIIDFKAGKARAFGFLVGQVMKLTNGKAAPSVVNDLLTKKLQ